MKIMYSYPIVHTADASIYIPQLLFEFNCSSAEGDSPPRLTKTFEVKTCRVLLFLLGILLV